MIDGFLVAVTVFSLSMATIMAVISWRVIRASQRLEDSAEAPVRVRQTPSVAARTPEVAGWPPVATRRSASVEAPMPGLDARTRRTAVTVGFGAMAVTIAVGSVLLFGGNSSTPASISPAAARVARPLELVSLDAARLGNRLTIKGLVRNPASGTRVEQLQAVVFLFDARGMYVGTSQATVVRGSLSPGAESSFEVPLTSGIHVSRYRVSFRVATAPVPHVDRRPAPTGRGKAGAGERVS
jgi:hypothetical protein